MRCRTSRDGTDAIPPSKLMKITEAARELTVSTRTAWRLIGHGDLASVRVGRAVRVTRASLIAFIARGGRA